MSDRAQGRRPLSLQNPTVGRATGAWEGETLDFDQFAANFDVRYTSRFDYAGVEHCLLASVAGQEVNVLEVGCGTGHWLRKLRPLVRHIAGVDPAPKMLKLAGAAVHDADLRVGCAERLPWPDETFDRVFVVNSLHLFTDLRSAVTEARRVLRPGGRYVTIGQDPHMGQDRWCVYEYFPRTRDIDRRRYPSCSQIRALMQELGLSDCTTVEAQRFKMAVTAREALAEGLLDRHITSLLALVTDDEYMVGLRKIRQEAARREAAGGVLELVADLRLYRTCGVRV